MMKITQNKGFHMTFENGMTISCQIGKNNNCDNRDVSHDLHEEMKQMITKCENCEVAIWDKDDNFVTKQIFKELNLDHDDEDNFVG